MTVTGHLLTFNLKMTWATVILDPSGNHSDGGKGGKVINKLVKKKF